MDETGRVGFNKRRAEGKDKSDRPRKSLQLKVRELNPANTIAYAQVYWFLAFLGFLCLGYCEFGPLLIFFMEWGIIQSFWVLSNSGFCKLDLFELFV